MKVRAAGRRATDRSLRLQRDREAIEYAERGQLGFNSSGTSCTREGRSRKHAKVRRSSLGQEPGDRQPRQNNRTRCSSKRERSVQETALKALERRDRSQLSSHAAEELPALYMTDCGRSSSCPATCSLLSAISANRGAASVADRRAGADRAEGMAVPIEKVDASVGLISVDGLLWRGDIQSIYQQITAHGRYSLVPGGVVGATYAVSPVTDVYSAATYICTV